MAQPKVNAQLGHKRVKNFQEVSLGYSKRVTQEEARRCPQCQDPVCQAACPVGVDIPGFIRLLREKNIAGAYEVIRKHNCLPAVCGRICSAPCEAACVLNDEEAPIGIRALERYAADFGRPRLARADVAVRKGKKIAVVGSGPAGLAAASALAQEGFQVTVFEAMEKPGGVLRYGIPEFRLPKQVLDDEIAEIEALGVTVRTNFFIGQTATLADLLQEGFVAVLLTTGAGIPKFMDIPGTQYGGVYYGEEFLMRLNGPKAQSWVKKEPPFFVGEKVAVIGSGNTALDCARAAQRLGRETTVFFRRTEEEMRVRQEERERAKEEGARLEPLVKPMAILPNQELFVEALKCTRMDFADETGSGQWQLIPVENSEFLVQADTVIIAIGHRPNTLLKRGHPDLELEADGRIRVDPQTFQTSLPGVFACGNAVTNAGPLVEAMGAGKRAARSIAGYLR